MWFDDDYLFEPSSKHTHGGDGGGGGGGGGGALAVVEGGCVCVWRRRTLCGGGVG
jgi:hypothetical protein